MITRAAALAFACVVATAGANGAELQGILADWTCVKPMVKNGRAKVLKQDAHCSLTPQYSRSAYGLILDDKRYYKLDDAGRAWALRLLKDTSNKDSLHVIVTGEVAGDTIHVTNMSEL